MENVAFLACGISFYPHYTDFLENKDFPSLLECNWELPYGNSGVEELQIYFHLCIYKICK